MPTVVNATQENITVKVAGNYFTFKPGQERVIHSLPVARFIEMDLKDSGLCVLPELMRDDEEVSPEELEERKKELGPRIAELVEQALDRYVAKHRAVIYNNQVSMRRDLEMKNIKVDPAALASKGELDSMRLVSKYQKRTEDAEASKIAEVKKLMDQVKKGS